MTVAGALRKLSVHEYHRMAEAGILHEDDRIELIEGGLREMTAIGRRHASMAAVLDWILGQLSQRRWLVWTQNPIRLDRFNEPQPDVSLLRWRADFYRSREAGPEDVRVLIEVADSSVNYDRGEKLRLYARYHIPEYWIVDLNENRIEVYSRPSEAGFDSLQLFGKEDRLVSPTVAGLELDLHSILE